MPTKTHHLAHPKTTLKSVTVHDNLAARRTLIVAFFVGMHALAISYCVSTSGLPYAAAVAERAKLENATNQTNRTNMTLADDLAAAADGAVLVDDEAVSSQPGQASTPPGRGADEAAAAASTAGSGGFGDEEFDDDLDFDAAEAATPKPAHGSGTVDSGGETNASKRSSTFNISTFNATKTERPLPHEWL